MANQNQKVEQKTEGTTTEQVMQQAPQQNGAPVAEQPQPVVQVQVVPEQQKQGFGGWLKKHWKGVAAASAGVGAAVGSAFMAYKKGKAAGIMSCPVPQQTETEDYSLDPNK